MAIIPAIIIFGQEEGITIVKDGKLEVNTVFDPLRLLMALPGEEAPTG